ncbi:P-loop containing nucleoside triphosphate hydrolase protein [Panus rudis PR-1116 ss-1]|nr:P-loop containing nucleoside triphosphate hydrolase protein [Panus rudis PR-1116 ss-1]
MLARASRPLVPNTRNQLTNELWVSLFHTSAPKCAKRQKLGVDSVPGPSRTRLVKSLKPKASGKSAGRLEVAPQATFSRDSVPHVGVEIKEKPGRFLSKLSKSRLSRRRQEGLRWKEDDEAMDASSVDPAPSSVSSLPAALRLTPAPSQAEERPRRPKIENPLATEFNLSLKAVPNQNLPVEFSSPPLMEGLRASVLEILGPDARPSPIQALSMKHLFNLDFDKGKNQNQWRQYLLASETGSGKSIAYLLPMLQHLKQSEWDGTASRKPSKRAISPRALVLSPTHELSRQLSVFAKSLLHNVKLRVVCASRANAPSSQSKRNVTASQMASELDEAGNESGGEFVISPVGSSARPVDVLVGTPTRVLEMVRGRGWDRERTEPEEPLPFDKSSRNKPKRFIPPTPELGLENVEWVVVDEADVLFDPDFQESTRLLLADIAAARGHPVDFQPQLNLPGFGAKEGTSTTPEIPEYPFNLILTTATIPSSLAAYLDTYHPSLTRLASPNLHKLPSTLQTEYENWTGGRRNKDVENRIRKVWWEDSIAAGKPTSTESVTTENGFFKSKILIFCNKSSKVEELGKYLTERGIPNVALTSTSESRQRGNNHHLDAFLRDRAGGHESAATDSSNPDQPHVLITTSLLSRGLDFSPSIKHVFIMDPPRNMVDFLHRAGRSGRAGEQGKVVVFGKGKGRGSDRDRGIRQKVKALAV